MGDYRGEAGRARSGARAAGPADYRIEDAKAVRAERLAAAADYGTLLGRNGAYHIYYGIGHGDARKVLDAIARGELEVPGPGIPPKELARDLGVKGRPGKLADDMHAAMTQAHGPAFLAKAAELARQALSLPDPFPQHAAAAAQPAAAPTRQAQALTGTVPEPVYEGHVRRADGSVVSLQCHEDHCPECPDQEPDDQETDTGPLDGRNCEHGCGHGPAPQPPAPAPRQNQPRPAQHTDGPEL
jgi:hypothetical protein